MFIDNIKDLEKRAYEGYAQDQFYLGEAYKHGYLVSKNDVEAVYWYKKAAGQGNIQALSCLGIYCEEGRGGLHKDLTRAIEYFLKGAEAGDPQAQYRLGLCYELGKGLPQKIDEAIKLYDKAAQADVIEAQYHLGLCYEKIKDFDKAFYWWKKAAENKDPQAQCVLGQAYEKSIGTKQDFSEAFKWYEASISSYEELKKQKSYREIMDWQIGRSQFLLGRCYGLGYGVEINMERMIFWWKKAADNHYNEALGKLGFCYDVGKYVDIDKGQAIYFYEKASENNYALASYNLGVCYEIGDGVPKNQEKAIMYYKKAEENGCQLASNILLTLNSPFKRWINRIFR